MVHIMVTSQEAAETKLDSKLTEKSALTGSKAKAGNSEVITEENATSTVNLSVVSEPSAPTEPDQVMRKRELLDAVINKSGIKKKDAKPVVEAMLEVLGSALQDGRTLNLQPMGKFIVKHEKKLANGKVLTTRIRQAYDLPANDIEAETDVE